MKTRFRDLTTVTASVLLVLCGTALWQPKATATMAQCCSSSTDCDGENVCCPAWCLGAADCHEGDTMLGYCVSAGACTFHDPSCGDALDLTRTQD